MTVEEVLALLQAHGDARARAVWERFRGRQEGLAYYGCSITIIKKLLKMVPKDDALALALWHTPVHDARLLATYLMDGKAFSYAEALALVANACEVETADKLASYVLVKCKHAVALCEALIGPGPNFTRRCGFALLYALAKGGKPLPEALLAHGLALIGTELQTVPNWVKDSMNTALLGYAKQPAPWPAQALAVAEALGPITVDYGETSCTTPDAARALRKVVLG